MRYRTVGKTGVKISEIGFGCGNNAVLMVKASHEDQVKAVRHALDLGINFFDTAFAHGLGKSEENLGGILKELGAEPVISTKVRLEADCLGDVRAATIRAVEAGLSRLQRDHVDFVQLHTRVTLARGMGKRFSLTPQDVFGPNGVIDGFKTMRDRGKVGHFGFSGLGDPKALHELVDSGGAPEHATASSICIVLEKPTRTVETSCFIKPKRMAAWVSSFPLTPSADLTFSAR